MQSTQKKAEGQVLNNNPTKEQLLEIRGHFQYGSVGYMLCTIDWSRMTYSKIAQALDSSQSRVQEVVRFIRKEYGVEIPHKTSPRAWSKPWYKNKQKELGIGNKRIRLYMLDPRHPVRTNDH